MASRRVALTRRAFVVTRKLLPIVLRGSVACCRTYDARRATAIARSLRVAFQDLGPTFVKLGQALASREDILSDEIAREMRGLCDQVPPFPTEHATAVLSQELGLKAPALPSSAVAAASLGQVYKVIVDGRTYALKVQRPGIDSVIAIDIVLLKGLARLLRRCIRRFCATPVDPEVVTDQFAQVLWRELDYLHEARTMQFMRNRLCHGQVTNLVIPRVRWELTSTRVLTTEWEDGLKVTEHPRAIRESHIRIGVETFAAMILDLGVVHADPHPGNLLVTGRTGQKLCLLDFGMVVAVPPGHREAWASCLVNLVRGDYEAVLDALILIGFFPASCSRTEVLAVMSQIWAELVRCGSNTKKRKQAVRTLYAAILTVVRRFEFNLPDYYVALVRCLLTLEGIALSADCEFDIFKAAFPVAVRALGAGGSLPRQGLALARAVAVHQISEAASSMRWRVCQLREEACEWKWPQACGVLRRPPLPMSHYGLLVILLLLLATGWSLAAECPLNV